MSRTSKASVGGLTVEYLQAGLGQRPILLCHGFTGAKEDFAAEIDGLAERGWHAVAPDLPGHGRSAHPDDDPRHYSTRAYAQLVLDLADQLGWDRFVLLGHSMGGVVAQEVALERHERLAGLILMDTLHGPLDVDRDQVEKARRIVEVGGIEVLLEFQRGRDDPMEAPAHRRLVAERPGYADFCARKLAESSPVMYSAVLGELADLPDTLDALRGLDVPTLVLVGEQDQLFLRHADALARTVPRARLVTIPDAGHSPQFENQPQWRSAVYEFLDELVLAGA